MRIWYHLAGIALAIALGYGTTWAVVWTTHEFPNATIAVGGFVLASFFSVPIILLLDPEILSFAQDRFMRLVSPSAPGREPAERAGPQRSDAVLAPISGTSGRPGS